MKQRLTLAALLLALMAYGCAPKSGAPAPAPTATNPLPATPRGTSPSLQATSAPSATVPVRPAATTPPNLMEPGMSQLVDEIMRNLSERLGVPVDQITILEVESVMWSDASLGCPRPGMMYVQAVTPGYRILLEAQGQTYPYHSDERGRFVLCTDNDDPDRFIPYGEPLDPDGR